MRQQAMAQQAVSSPSSETPGRLESLLEQMLGKIDMFANQAAKASDPKNEGNNQPMPAPLPAPASKPAETAPNAEESGSESDDDQGSEEDYITTPDGQRVA